MFRKLSLAVAVLLLPSTAWAWGPEGHEVVAAVAQANLTAAARAQVSALLGGDNMIVLDANWADEIRADRPETSSWHYANIPLDSRGYDPRRDCAGDLCVVAQIERDGRILADTHAPKNSRAEALRFLIHFVGDVHQPLHSADNHDKGGNTFAVILRRKHTNLHHVWDDDVVAALGDNPMQVARQINAGLTPQQKLRDSGGNAADWANESLAAARTIYAQIKGPFLPGDYGWRQSAPTRDRLAKAGLRLAGLLNRILK